MIIIFLSFLHQNLRSLFGKLSFVLMFKNKTKLWRGKFLRIISSRKVDILSDNRARHAKLAHLLKIEEESRRLDTSASSSGTISSNRRRRSKECLSASKSGSPKKHTAKRRLVMK